MTQGELEKIPDRIVKAMNDLEIRIMDDVVRRIKINGFSTAGADWQVDRLRQLGMSEKEIKEWVRQTMETTEGEVDRIFSDEVYEQYMKQGRGYKAYGREQIPFDENIELQQLIEAVKRQANDELEQITGSMGFVRMDPMGRTHPESLSSFYTRTLDDAMYDIHSGAFDYNTVLKRTIEDMTKSGLRWIDYESGWHNRVPVAARRAVMTGFRQVQGKINEQTAEALGTDSYEVTVHIGARPTHQVWEGKIWTMTQLRTVCGLGEVTGLHGANCYHDYNPFIPGVDVPAYSQEELDQIHKQENTPKRYNGKEYTTYEALQRQRKLETRARKYREDVHLLELGGGSEDDIIAKKCRYQGTLQEYRDFSKKMDLPMQKERIYQDGLKVDIPERDLSKVAAARPKFETKEKMPAKSVDLAERRKQRMAERKRRQAEQDFDQMNGKQLKEYAEKNLKTHFTGLDGANTDYVREAVKVMSKFESRMGGQTIDGLTVQFGGLPKGVYAKYDDKTKTLILKKTGSIKQFEEGQRAANLRYRMKWRTDKDYHATETYSGTIWHELGHAVDIESGQAFSRSLSASATLDEASVKVSAYAGTTQNVRATKRSEAWAENFAAYMDGGKNKSRVPQEIADMIEQSFEQGSLESESGRLARLSRQQARKETLREMLKNSVTIGTPYIEPERITSQAFSSKFSKITENSAINNRIRSLAQGNLTKNNGSYTEMLDILDLDTGESVIHKLGGRDELGVSLTVEERATVRGYKGRMIGMHNHPTNIYPTGSDFVVAAARGYDFGIVVTHDLRVFKYTGPTVMVNPQTIDKIIEKHTKMLYNDNEKRIGFETAMRELERRFGITWQEM